MPTNLLLKLLKKCVEAVLTKWRDLHLLLKGPKIHAVEDHLVCLMIFWNWIGCFLEDFFEQFHQIRKFEEKRSGHMGDWQKTAISHSKHEWARTLIPKILLEKERVHAQTCKKWSRYTVIVKNSKAAREKSKRQRIQNNILITLAWYQILLQRHLQSLNPIMTTVSTNNNNNPQKVSHFQHDCMIVRWCHTLFYCSLFFNILWYFALLCCHAPTPIHEYASKINNKSIKLKKNFFYTRIWNIMTAKYIFHQFCAVLCAILYKFLYPKQ